MKNFLTWLDKRWHLFLIGGCIGLQALVFLIYREDSYLTVQDNLDLFIAHFRVMSENDGWFSHGKIMPMLGGISRDCLSSEWNVYNILFAFLPVFPAYMIGYFLKILIGMGSFVLLVKDIWPQKFARYRQIAWAAGLCYGMLPLFPAYGLAFASIPLAVFLCRRIYFRKGRIWYAALFLYPLLSYFSYFGIFILGYLLLAILILWVRDGLRGRKAERGAAGIAEAGAAAGGNAGNAEAGAAAGGNAGERKRGIFRFFSWRLLAALIVLSLGRG